MDKQLIRRKVSKYLHIPGRHYSSAHPRYMTRLYVTGSALFLLAVGISSAQALRSTPESDRPKSDTAAQSKDNAPQSLSNESNAELNNKVSSDQGAAMNQSGQDTSSTSSTDVSVRSDQSSTSVTVNGDTTTVPPNESVNRSYQSDDGNTHVDVSIDNKTSGETSSRRSQLKMNMHSSSTVDSSQDISR